ncbi:hypothetical protein ACFL34_02360 [Candidatus Sumerlaeota bacterium]
MRNHLVTLPTSVWFAILGAKKPGNPLKSEAENPKGSQVFSKHGGKDFQTFSVSHPGIISRKQF